MIIYKILFAEDVADDMELAERELRKAGLQFISKRVETRNDFIEQIKTFKPDVVISDYSMPSFNGMEAVKIVLDLAPYTPIIIHTGSINEETAVNCMKAGAYDYILKEKILRLPFALREAYEKSLIVRQNKESQAALKISEEKYKGLFNAIAQGVFYLDENLKISMLNPSVLNILMIEDYRCETLNQLYDHWTFTTDKGKIFDFCEFVSGEKASMIGGHNRQANLNHIIHAYNKRTGIDKWLQTDIIYESLIDKDLPCQVLIIIEDITAQRKSMIELINAKEKAEESDRLKSAFLSNLSHEVRTPMNAILGFSDLLLETTERMDETEKMYVNTIRTNSFKLLKIISDIVEISKIETEKISVFNSDFYLSEIRSYINELIQLAEPTKEVNISIKGFDSNVIINCDEQKFKKVIANLLDNAFKFTDKGQISVTCKLKAGQIEVHIQDTGIGIPSELKDKIFERFRQADESYSRRHGGTGLGLSIAKAYVVAMNGEIWYSSTSDGTIFIFRLPCQWSFSKKMEDYFALESCPDYSDHTVLIAEDDNTNYAYLSRILKYTGIKVLYATDGIETIELYGQNKQSIDLILMDIKMPLLNGYEATRQIREIDKIVPIIATTAYAMNGDKEKCLEAGCNAYISKPIRKFDLYNILNKHLLVRKTIS